MYGKKDLISFYNYKKRQYENIDIAFGLDDKSKIAIIGAGGKTTTLYNIGKYYESKNLPCILTTTTNMSYDDKALDDINRIKKRLFEKKIVLVGSYVYKGIRKLKSINNIERLFSLGVPIIVEADGAKRKSIKIQRDYEPVIPKYINKVILIVGVDCLDKEVKDVSARPLDVIRFLKKPLNAKLTFDDIAKIITDKKGLYKDLENKEVIILLNKVDNKEIFNKSLILSNFIEKYNNKTKIILGKSI